MERVNVKKIWAILIGLIFCFFFVYRSKRILENKGFWQILEIYRRMDPKSVPSEAKKGLYRAFIRVGAGLIDYRTRSCEALLQHWIKVILILLFFHFCLLYLMQSCTKFKSSLNF